MKLKKQHLLNQEIKNRKIRLVGEHAKQELIFTQEGIRIAESLGLDLVLLKTDGDIGICKIMSYEKYLYEQMKREKEKQKSLPLKEIKIGPNTGDNDLEYRKKHIIEFLEKGHPVKITMQFKGREMAYVTKGEELMLKLSLEVSDYGTVESMPKLEGKKMFVNVRPKPKNK